MVREDTLYDLILLKFTEIYSVALYKVLKNGSCTPENKYILLLLGEVVYVFLLE